MAILIILLIVFVCSTGTEIKSKYFSCSATATPSNAEIFTISYSLEILEDIVELKSAIGKLSLNNKSY